MKCPKCKGYGIIGDAVPDILRGRGHIFSSNECDMCHGSGEVPMTNESRKQNAEELRRAWNKFIKEQDKKNAEQGKQTEVQQGD